MFGACLRARWVVTGRKLAFWPFLVHGGVYMSEMAGLSGFDPDRDASLVAREWGF